uniref:Uncharacterized protein n=1 Tax=Triticum urartu TaxID=4572 RepID=A0A8R7U8H6_TRIUA
MAQERARRWRQQHWGHLQIRRHRGAAQLWCPLLPAPDEEDQCLSGHPQPIQDADRHPAGGVGVLPGVAHPAPEPGRHVAVGAVGDVRGVVHASHGCSTASPSFALSTAPTTSTSSPTASSCPPHATPRAAPTSPASTFSSPPLTRRRSHRLSPRTPSSPSSPPTTRSRSSPTTSPTTTARSSPSRRSPRPPASRARGCRS